MTYLEALDLSLRIKQDRPDVLARLIHHKDRTEVIVKRMYDKVPGRGPTRLGPPCFIQDEQDWIRLRSTI